MMSSLLLTTCNVTRFNRGQQIKEGLTIDTCLSGNYARASMRILRPLHFACVGTISKTTSNLSSSCIVFALVTDRQPSTDS